MARLRTITAQALIALARTRAGGFLVRCAFAHLAGRLPVARLHETEMVVAFHHPKPAYAIHVLIVPKRSLAGPHAITGRDAALLFEIVAAARSVARTLTLEEHGYQILVNGGAFQEVGQLHFHLISNRPGREGPPR